MGIVNLTTDSFSGDGLIKKNYSEIDILKRCESMINEGADILDLGAESTRPDSKPICLQEEQRRLIPILEKLKENFSIPISIDTYNPETAKIALNKGADIINNVKGDNQEMLKLMVQYDCPLIIMHNLVNNKEITKNSRLGSCFQSNENLDITNLVFEDLKTITQNALDLGIKADNIIIDPGIGFGKSVQENLQLINNLGYLKKLGYPILVGNSNKSFIGYTLDLPPKERLTGTIVANTISIQNGANILRVHNVKEAKNTLTMTKAILQ